MKVDFEGAGPAYKSYMGATVSIIFILISATFLMNKIVVLVTSSQIMIMSKVLAICGEVPYERLYSQYLFFA